MATQPCRMTDLCALQVVQSCSKPLARLAWVQERGSDSFPSRSSHKNIQSEDRNLVYSGAQVAGPLHLLFVRIQHGCHLCRQVSDSFRTSGRRSAIHIVLDTPHLISLVTSPGRLVYSFNLIYGQNAMPRIEVYAPHCPRAVCGVLEAMRTKPLKVPKSKAKRRPSFKSGNTVPMTSTQVVLFQIVHIASAVWEGSWEIMYGPSRCRHHLVPVITRRYRHGPFSFGFART